MDAKVLTRVKLKVFGRVQGVFYRQSTRSKASALGLSGYARNVDDGTVEIEAWGDDTAIDALVEWCGQGPPAANVSRVEVKERSPAATGESPPSRFEIH